MKKGWTFTTIGETCEVVNGGTPKTSVDAYWGGDNAWLTPAEMGARTSPRIGQTARKLTDLGLQECSARLLPPYSVILSSRAPIGHLAINTIPMATNQGCKGLIPNRSLDSTFLYYYLSSIVEELNALGTGVTFKELSGGKLKEVRLPALPLSEQHRLVRILDEAFAKVAVAKEMAEASIQKAQVVFSTKLQQLMTRHGMGWETHVLAKVATHSLGKMLDKKKNKGELKPYLRNFNVRWFGFDLSDVQEMRFLPEEKARYSVERGDVVICEGGYPGRAAVWDNAEPVFFQKALHRVRFRNPEMNRWFMYLLFARDTDGTLKDSFGGTGIQHFTGEALARFPVLVPPEREISGYVLGLDALLVETRRLVSIHERKRAALDELKQSLLHHAFTGEL